MSGGERGGDHMCLFTHGAQDEARFSLADARGPPLLRSHWLKNSAVWITGEGK